MKRIATIEEEHGIYTVRSTSGDFISYRSRSLEHALLKASKGEPPAQAAFNAAEVIEQLLGARHAGDHGQIQEGVQGA